MIDTKKLREIFKKSTQRKWKAEKVEEFNGFSEYLVFGDMMYDSTTCISGEDKEFICQAHENFEAILDEIESLREEKHIWEETRRMNKELSSDVLKLRKYIERIESAALEKCKEQKREWAKFGFNSKMDSWPHLEKEDAELDKILKGSK